MFVSVIQNYAAYMTGVFGKILPVRGLCRINPWGFLFEFPLRGLAWFKLDAAKPCHCVTCWKEVVFAHFHIPMYWINSGFCICQDIGSLGADTPEKFQSVGVILLCCWHVVAQPGFTIKDWAFVKSGLPYLVLHCTYVWCTPSMWNASVPLQFIHKKLDFEG